MRGVLLGELIIGLQTHPFYTLRQMIGAATAPP